MKKFDMTKSVYYERYKTSTLEDVILPEVLKSKLKDNIRTQNIPNMLLCSVNPGTGKSALCNAILTEIGGEALWINASMEKGIDVLRGKIAGFASSCSFDDNIKIVVMDEFDHFSKDGQAAFRGFIDEFSNNCRFIFTCNYKEKIIEPLLSRLEIYNFDEFDKPELVKPIFERLSFILKNEGTEFEPRDLVPVINTYYPSIRAMIGTLQKYTIDGVFKVKDSELDDLNIFDECIKLAKPDKYQLLITAVNKLNAPDNMYSFLYLHLDTYFKPSTLPNVIISLAKYQYQATASRDKNLNLAACLTELMVHTK